PTRQADHWPTSSAPLRAALRPPHRRLRDRPLPTITQLPSNLLDDLPSPCLRGDEQGLGERRLDDRGEIEPRGCLWPVRGARSKRRFALPCPTDRNSRRRAPRNGDRFVRNRPSRRSITHLARRLPIGGPVPGFG